MKTTIISIPTSAASDILKSIHQNNVPCKYVGLDQEGRILMELSYEQAHDKLIRELIQYIKEKEQLMNEINQSLKEAFNQIKKEEDDKFRTMINEFRLKIKKSKETTKTYYNGNQ